jgi:O-antigen/teichoic acid export membrane protein
VLVVSLSELIAVLVLPYLSREWEEGRRSEVSRRVVLALKLTSCGMFFASAVIVAVAPWLVERLFQGKYSTGLALMPWTLAYCSLWGLLSVAQNYLWCAERVRLTALPLLIGLAANIALNAVLLPIWGLFGAVAATTLANLTAVLLTIAISRFHGLETDSSLWALLLLPLLIGFGYGPALVAAPVLAAAIVRGDWLLNRSEKDQVCAVFLEYARKLRSRGKRWELISS